MRPILFFIFLALSSFAFSQSFEVDQIEQLFRPRLRVDGKYSFDSRFADTSGALKQGEGGAVFTFPVRTKLGAEINTDVFNLKLKDLLTKSVRIKASQTLGMFRINARQAHFGFDSLPQKNMVHATAGIMGVRLTKKYRVMFYSANVSLSEQDKTIDKTVPRFTALIGQLHVRGLRKNFFYGVAAVYSDGLPLAAPFFGGSQPIGEKFIFNYTLPVQLNLQYKPNSKTLLTAGVCTQGFRSGIVYTGTRLNVNYTSAAAFGSVRYKFNKTFVGRLEGGYNFWQHVNFTEVEHYRTDFPVAPGAYVQAGFSVLFGKSLWEKVLHGVLQH